jgi:glycine C-acetyltransferase
LKEVVEMKKKYNFRLLVDEAHGFGTLGKTGAGAGEEQGCQEGIDIYFSTFFFNICFAIYPINNSPSWYV